MNPWPSGCHPDALPTELQPRAWVSNDSAALAVPRLRVRRQRPPGLLQGRRTLEPWRRSTPATSVPRRRPPWRGRWFGPVERSSSRCSPPMSASTWCTSTTRNTAWCGCNARPPDGSVTSCSFGRAATRRICPATTSGKVDVFGVYSPDTDRVYLVPANGLPRRSCYLRLTPTRNGQTAGVRWADDFELGRP